MIGNFSDNDGFVVVFFGFYVGLGMYIYVFVICMVGFNNVGVIVNNFIGR